MNLSHDERVSEKIVKKIKQNTNQQKANIKWKIIEENQKKKKVEKNWKRK